MPDCTNAVHTPIHAYSCPLQSQQYCADWLTVNWLKWNTYIMEMEYIHQLSRTELGCVRDGGAVLGLALPMHANLTQKGICMRDPRLSAACQPEYNVRFYAIVSFAVCL